MNRFRSLALTAGLAIGAAFPGSAAITWFPTQDIGIPTTPAGVVVNLQTGANVPGDDAPGADVNFFFGGFGIANDADSTATMPSFQPVRIGAGILDAVDNLTVGTTVDAGSTFATGFGGSASHIPTEFTAGTPGYLGFSLDTGSGTVYGWMRVTLEANTTEGIIHEWAYESSGGAILVGAIPEPSISLLALLAVGGLALRRRR